MDSTTTALLTQTDLGLTVSPPANRLPTERKQTMV